jgi:hypothetical protein
LAIYYRNAHAISLKVFFPTKPIVLADWFSFMQKPNVIVRVPEKKESGRKANRNPAHGIQKIEITVYGDLPRKLDGLARPYVLTGGYVELARWRNALQCHFLLIHVRTIWSDQPRASQNWTRLSLSLSKDVLTNFLGPVLPNLFPETAPIFQRYFLRRAQASLPPPPDFSPQLVTDNGKPDHHHGKQEQDQHVMVTAFPLIATWLHWCNQVLLVPPVRPAAPPLWRMLATASSVFPRFGDRFAKLGKNPRFAFFAKRFNLSLTNGVSLENHLYMIVPDA